jgi:hypothetical protein
MLSMLRRICRVHKDVVHVYSYELVPEGFQHAVHHSLESGRSLRQPKAQHLELKAPLRNKGKTCCGPYMLQAMMER